MGEKQIRFFVRLSDDDRRVIREVTDALGLSSDSDAVRFVMREKHRELFPPQEKQRKGRRP